LPDGSFPREPSPASSFYHIVCAIGELAAALDGAAPSPPAPALGRG